MATPAARGLPPGTRATLAGTASRAKTGSKRPTPCKPRTTPQSPTERRRPPAVGLSKKKTYLLTQPCRAKGSQTGVPQCTQYTRSSTQRGGGDAKPKLRPANWTGPSDVETRTQICTSSRQPKAETRGTLLPCADYACTHYQASAWTTGAKRSPNLETKKSRTCLEGRTTCRSSRGHR